MTSRLHRSIDALSQLFNVIIFNGDSNHSISGDAYRFNRIWLMHKIDYIFSPWEDEHCKKSHLNDVKKASALLREQREA